MGCNEYENRVKNAGVLLMGLNNSTACDTNEGRTPLIHIRVKMGILKCMLNPSLNFNRTNQSIQVTKI